MGRFPENICLFFPQDKDVRLRLQWETEESEDFVLSKDTKTIIYWTSSKLDDATTEFSGLIMDCKDKKRWLWGASAAKRERSRSSAYQL